MKFQVRPTKVQALMIVLMGIAVIALGAWTVPELIGALGRCVECTYSEWVWDLPFWQMMGIVALHAIVLGAAGWSIPHFIRGWLRRRKIEKS